MAYAEIKCMIDLMGAPNALEVLFEGRTIGAKEAKAKGIVSRIVADAEVSSPASSSTHFGRRMENSTNENFIMTCSLE